MCVSNQVMYTNHIPDAFLFLLSFVPFFFFYIFSQKIGVSQKNFSLIFFVGLLYFLLFIKHPNNGLFRLIVMCGGWLNIASIILLSAKDKCKLLDIITNFIIVILIISSIGWILYLCGYGIPVYEYVDMHNDQHYLNNHFVFYDNAERDIFSIPRFRSVFIEPGQLATPCVYLFFARGGQFKDWKNIVLLISILLSFSLAGYVVLFLGIILNLIFVRRNVGIIKLLVLFSVMGTISFSIIKAANEDNPLYSLIFERLEYDEETGISGNDRSDTVFDVNFNKFVNSGDILFGIGDEMAEGEVNWANHASGIKKYLVNFGIVGVVTMILLTLLLLRMNYCRATLVFFIVIWTAYIVRDLLQSQFWLILAILGFFNLKNINRNNHF